MAFGDKTVTLLKRQCVERYVKPEVLKVKGAWPREMKIMNGLFDARPSIPFWTHHTLSFTLNSLAWFLTEDGKAQLDSDWTLFHYVPPAPEPVPELDKTLDSSTQPSYNPTYRARPKSVAAFLKTSL